MDFAGLKDEAPPREFADRVHEGFTRAVMESNSWLVVFQIQDVFGQTARFNTLGSIGATNWTQRLPQTVKQFDADPILHRKTKTFSHLAKKSGRTF